MAEQSTSQATPDVQSDTGPKLQSRNVTPDIHTRATPHLPPPHSVPSTPLRARDEESNRRTININIQIDIPKDFLPYFNGTRSCVPLGFWRFLIGFLYLLFIIGASIALGFYEDYDLGFNRPILVIALIVPFLDLIANIWVVRLMKSDRDHDPKKPSFKHAIVLLINGLLLILNFVIMIFACVWTDGRYHAPWWIGYSRAAAIKNAAIGFTIFDSVAMIIIKLILAYFVFVHPESFKGFHIGGFGFSIRHRRNAGYEELGQDVDEDARIRPGTYVDHSDDEETPRNSSEQGRIILH